MNSETIVQIAIPAILATIMFTMGLGLTVDDFRRVVAHPRAVGVGAVSQLIVLPSVGFLFAWGFGLSAELGVGLVLLSSCPGGPSSNLMTHLAGADTALSVTLTALSGVVTIISIPLVVNLALTVLGGASTPRELPILQTNLQILLIVGVPVAAGMLVRRFSLSGAARLERVLKVVSVILLLVLVVGAVAKESTRVMGFLQQVGWVVVLFNVVTMALGFGLARAARVNKRQTVAVTLEVGMQNAAMAIGIAVGILQSTAVAIPAVVYGLWMYLTCGMVMWAGRRWIASAPSS